MPMSKFVYIEDIIEYIAGYRDHNNTALGMWEKRPIPLSLARYDVKMIDSLAYQTSELVKGYTQKQSELAIKLVQKYRKQLATQPYPIEVPEKNNFKLGIRFVDTTKRIWIDDQNIYVRFPYNKELIETLKSTTKENSSTWFDWENKTWVLPITEYIINFVATLARTHQFELDQKIEELYIKILDMEKINYKIQLKFCNDRLVIENAAANLLDYIEKFCGGLHINNLTKLVDMSGVLGYTVSIGILKTLRKVYSKKELRLLAANRFNFIEKNQTKPDNKISMEDVLAYAKITDRLPMHVYETGTVKPDTEEIIYLNNKANQIVDPTQIKLLVSSTPVLIGTRKQNWFRMAEKVIILK